MIPMYSTKIFTDIWSNVTTFKQFYHNNGFPVTIDDNHVETCYWLLYAKYGNSPIANDDENQFKYKVMGVIFQYAPTWAKRLDIQESLRSLSEEDLRAGSKAIYNHSYNPSTEPSTDTLTEIQTINDQNTTNQKRGKLEAYALLWDLLATDVSGEFISKFAPLFKQFVYPEHPVLYVTETTEGEEDDD